MSSATIVGHDSVMLIPSIFSYTETPATAVAPVQSTVPDVSSFDPLVPKPPSVPTVLYRLCKTEEWKVAKANCVLGGSAIDRRDGYIHLSTDAQCKETWTKHFKEGKDCLRLQIDVKAVYDHLKMEAVASRGGEYFAHYYPVAGQPLALPISAIVSADTYPPPPSETVSLGTYGYL